MMRCGGTPPRPKRVYGNVVMARAVGVAGCGHRTETVPGARGPAVICSWCDGGALRLALAKHAP